MNRKVVTVFSSVVLFSSISIAQAGECPVEWYNQDGAFDPTKPSLTMAEEFGDTWIDENGNAFPYDVQANTLCNNKKSGAKVVLQVDNHWSKDATGKVTAFWLSTRREMLRNYAIQGMEVGKDVDVVVVLSTVGATLAVKSHARFAGATPADPTSTDNPFDADIKAALDSGIKIYVCQTAARALGIKAQHLIDPRIQFVPGGHIAVADFQEKGYAHLMYK
jgi:intracellular sulfur oxidation DsrE/DsrF family protein